MSSKRATVHLSPEQLRKNGRKYLTRIDDQDRDRKESLTASLPANFSMAQAMSNRRPNVLQSDFQRSFTLSPTYPVQRGRSSSLHAGNALKRSLRLPRSRPNSAQGGRRGSLRLPSIHRRRSNSEEPVPTPESLDNAFEKIKLQLAKLSEEDHSLSERLEKLNDEINTLHNTHASLFVKPRARGPKSRSSDKLSSLVVQHKGRRSLVPMVMVSSTSDNNIQAQTEKAWATPTELNKIQFGDIQEMTRKLSCSSVTSDASSCGDALSESQTCLLVIGDHSPTSSGTEDEVFLTLP